MCTVRKWIYERLDLILSGAMLFFSVWLVANSVQKDTLGGVIVGSALVAVWTHSLIRNSVHYYMSKGLRLRSGQRQVIATYDPHVVKNPETVQEALAWNARLVDINKEVL